MKSSLLLVSFLSCVAVCHADAVRLKIVGPDGKPVAGAKVRVVEGNGLMWMNSKAPAPVDLQSDAAGAVAFESKGSLADTKEPRTQTFLLAQVNAAGLAVGQTQLKAGDNTLSLAKGHTLSGTLLDEQEKPVAGVKVVLRSLEVPNAPKTGVFAGREYFMGDDAPQSVSDASGKWSIDGVPPSGSAGISVTDPHFKSETFNLDASKPAPPLFVERGATIKGRLLKPDGTGAGGIKFYAGEGANPQTNPDGTFEVGGLGEERIYLQVPGGDWNQEKLPFIVPMKNVEGLKAGEFRDIGDWKAEAGTHVKGRVVDAATQKPIEGASVQLWGRGTGGNAQTDKDGAFDFLSSSDGQGLSVSADGFVSQQNQNVPDPKNGAIDVGILALKSGQKVTGTLKNEAGTPQGLSLYAQTPQGNRSYARSNDDGTFSFDGLEAGNYIIKSDGAEVVSGGTFSVGTGAPTALQVVVKGHDPLLVSSKVEGRVLDEDAHPVAGAKIHLQLRGASYFFGDQTVVSNLDGTFSAPISMGRVTPKITDVTRPGFIFGTGALTNQNGVWSGDILLQKRGSLLRGHVVDAQGQPVAGAFVGLSTGLALPVATDDKGNFALPDAPSHGVTLLASDGPRFASFALNKAGEALIALPDAAPVADKTALADDVLTRSRLGYNWQDKWDALGTKRIEAAFARAGGGDWAWNAFLRALVEREPETFLAREAELKAEMPQGSRVELERLDMVARAGSTDEAERAKVQTWLTAQQAQKRDTSAATVTQLLGIAQVAARFDLKQGAVWLDYATQVAAQLPPDNGSNSWEWGTLVASISPDAPAALVEEWTPSSALQLLGVSMSVLRERGDLAGARKTFALMEQLTTNAAQTPDKAPQDGSYHPKPKDLLNQGREQLVRTLALSDPGAALDAAAPLEEYQRAQVLIVIAKSAVKAKQLDIARRALSAVPDAGMGNVEFVAQAAGIAQGFDPALSASLFAQAYAKATPKNQNFGNWTPSLAAYAQAGAAKWPGQSRILIEREWTTRLETAKKPATDDYDPNTQSMSGLVSAMARVAPNRALEMAEQLPEKNDMRLQARGDIAAALLSSG